MAIMNTLQMALGVMKHKKLLKKYGVTPAENALMAYQHKQPYVIPNFFFDMGMVFPGQDMDHYIGDGTGKDGWGVSWVYVPEEGSPMPIAGEDGKYLLEDVADWKEVVKFPDLDAYDWAYHADRDIHEKMKTNTAVFDDSYERLPNGKTFVSGGKLGIAMVCVGMWERLHCLMGFENALMALLEDPESCYEFFGAVADWKIKYYQKIAQYYPDVKVIIGHDDYGTQNSMFMSLDTWRELLKPHLKRIVDATHELGLIYEHHSCGHVEPLLPEFVEIGIDSIDPVQGGSNPNLKELKQKYQRQLCFSGGFDNTFVFDRPGVTAEECRAEFRRTIMDLAPGGSYIAFPAALTGTSVLPGMLEYFAIGNDFYEKNK